MSPGINNNDKITSNNNSIQSHLLYSNEHVMTYEVKDFALEKKI